MVKDKKKSKKKKEPVEKPKKKAPVKSKSKLKQDLVASDDSGIIVVENDSNLDKDAELEARRAYLEEARSQEAED
jgi:regulator of RNase E activity RraA